MTNLLKIEYKLAYLSLNRIIEKMDDEPMIIVISGMDQLESTIGQEFDNLITQDRIVNWRQNNK